MKTYLRKLTNFPGVAAALLLAAPVFQSCNNKKYETCPPQDRVASWGVTRLTDAFGEYDSLYYIINPLGNVNDSLYFNGNYTDSYYHSDSTRVMLRYTTSDSIVFHIDRMYAVQTNPSNLLMTVKSVKDSTILSCELHLTKDNDNDNIYRCGPDSMFRKLLSDGDIIKFTATNTSSAAEPIGSQNYEFFIDATGFNRALALADSLNNPGKSQKTDSIKATNSEQKKKKDRKF